MFNSVKGCQTTGYYGHDCSIPCQNVNCQYCHIETGTCQGCKPGFKGQGCELGKSRKKYTSTLIFFYNYLNSFLSLV